MSEPSNDAQALEIAKRLASIGPALRTSLLIMELEGAKKEELQLAIIHRRPDGSGQVGPSWELGAFVEDLEKLALLLNTVEERLDLEAEGIATIFGGVRDSKA
jgi:hypothetical protein